jgi:hypothetical protein
MRKTYILLSLSAIPFFGLRLFDVLANMDKRAFFIAGSWARHIAVLALLIAGAVYMASVAKKAAPLREGPSGSVAAGRIFIVSAVLTASGSILLLTGSLERAGNLSNIFLSRGELISQGHRDLHFGVDFWCSFVGLAAAAWFIFAASRFLFRGGDISGRPFFCCIPAVWFGARAFSDYSLSPVNPNNSAVVASIAASLLLACFYLRYTRLASTGYPSAGAQKLAHLALLAFVFTVSFKLPLVAAGWNMPFPERIFILSDAAAASAAFSLTDAMLKGGPARHEKEMG